MVTSPDEINSSGALNNKQLTNRSYYIKEHFTHSSMTTYRDINVTPPICFTTGRHLPVLQTCDVTYLCYKRVVKLGSIEHPASTLRGIHGGVISGGSPGGGVWIMMDDLTPGVSYALANAWINVKTRRPRLVDSVIIPGILYCHEVILGLTPNNAKLSVQRL